MNEELSHKYLENAPKCDPRKIVTSQSVKQINRKPLQVLASCLAAASLAQFVDPEKAKILKEQRFNAGDGR